MKNQTFDLIVLGGGSGGIATAVRAAQYGAKVAVVESSHLGGTCVNLGCVPKKIMFNASLMADALHKAQDYCFSPISINLDWNNLVNKRNDYIAGLRENYAKRLKKLHIKLIKGKGSFLEAQSIVVDKHSYQAPHIVIATGGEPLVPAIEGVQHVIDSDGFFALNKQPEKVAIIGSGYIGVELAGMLHSLGSETHMLMRGQRPLSRFDSMLGDTLLEVMRQQGLHVHQNHRACSINLHSDGSKSIACPEWHYY